MATDQQFCLRWNNHQSTLISVFDTLLENGTLVDCTLAAEGQYLKAHKVVLSACSPYLETLLSQHYEKHPIVILKDVKFTELKSMMDYMYRGEVNISQDQLGTFLKAAESLQIKGLSDNGDDARDVGSTTTKRQDPPSRPAVTEVRSSVESKRPAPSGDISDASRDGSISPSSLRKRRRTRRPSQGDDPDSHLDTTNNSCDLPIQAQSTPLPVPSSTVVPTPVQNLPKQIVKQEPSISRLDNSSIAPESGLLKEKIEPPSEPLLEPKTEYLDYMNNENSIEVEDLTLDDDDELDSSMDASRPGPSHDLSNQGYPPWQMTGDQSGTDEIFMAAQQAVGAATAQQRDSQDLEILAEPVFESAFCTEIDVVEDVPEASDPLSSVSDVVVSWPKEEFCLGLECNLFERSHPTTNLKYRRRKNRSQGTAQDREVNKASVKKRVRSSLKQVSYRRDNADMLGQTPTISSCKYNAQPSTKLQRLKEIPVIYKRTAGRPRKIYVESPCKDLNCTQAIKSNSDAGVNTTRKLSRLRQSTIERRNLEALLTAQIRDEAKKRKISVKQQRKVQKKSNQKSLKLTNLQSEYKIIKKEIGFNKIKIKSIEDLNADSNFEQNCEMGIKICDVTSLGEKNVTSLGESSTISMCELSVTTLSGKSVTYSGGKSVTCLGRKSVVKDGTKIVKAQKRGRPKPQGPKKTNTKTIKGSKKIPRQFVSTNLFNCDQCERKYRYLKGLRQHKRYECNKEPQFPCPFCPTRCRYPHIIREHVALLHKEVYDKWFTEQYTT